MNDPRERTLKNAARYMGAARAAKNPTADWVSLMDAAYWELLAAAQPRHVLRRATLRTEGDTCYFGDMPPFISRDICRLFANCKEGYALLATLGMGVELAVRRLMVTNPALGMAVGACGSAYVDVYIDDLIGRERNTLLLAEGEGNPSVQGVFTPRFSPGYGDAPLSIQPELLRFLGGHKLGVHLTDGFLMVPEKSVTAFFGMTNEKTESCEGRCGLCAKIDCTFREETE